MVKEEEQRQSDDEVGLEMTEGEGEGWGALHGLVNRSIVVMVFDCSLIAVE